MRTEVKLFPMVACLFASVLCGSAAAGGQVGVRAISRPMAPATLAGLRGFLGSPAGAALLASSPRLGGLGAVLTMDPASPKTLALLGPLAAAMPAVPEGAASAASLAEALPAALDRAERIALAEMDARWEAARPSGREDGAARMAAVAEELAEYSFYGPDARMRATRYAIGAGSRRALAAAQESDRRFSSIALGHEGVPLGRIVLHQARAARVAEEAARLGRLPEREAVREAGRAARVEFFGWSLDWEPSGVVLPRDEVARVRALPGVVAMAVAEESGVPSRKRVMVIYEGQEAALDLFPRTLYGHPVTPVALADAVKGPLRLMTFDEAPDPALALPSAPEVRGGGALRRAVERVARRLRSARTFLRTWAGPTS